MSANDTRHRAGSTDESTDERPTDEPDASYLPYGGVPYGTGWGWALGWPPVYREDRDGETPDAVYAEGDDSLVGEALVSVLLLLGVVLFLFPEPATSAVGILLLALGVLAWIADAIVETTPP